MQTVWMLIGGKEVARSKVSQVPSILRACAIRGPFKIYWLIVQTNQLIVSLVCSTDCLTIKVVISHSNDLHQAVMSLFSHDFVL